jgi:hypothetical protein
MINFGISNQKKNNWSKKNKMVDIKMAAKHEFSIAQSFVMQINVLKKIKIVLKKRKTKKII